MGSDSKCWEVTPSVGKWLQVWLQVLGSDSKCWEVTPVKGRDSKNWEVTRRVGSDSSEGKYSMSWKATLSIWMKLQLFWSDWVLETEFPIKNKGVFLVCNGVPKHTSVGTTIILSLTTYLYLPLENCATLCVVVCRQQWLAVFHYWNMDQLLQRSHWRITIVFGGIAGRNPTRDSTVPESRRFMESPKQIYL